jgi:hypothetical protein
VHQIEPELGVRPRGLVHRLDLMQPRYQIEPELAGRTGCVAHLLDLMQPGYERERQLPARPPRQPTRSI